MFVAAIAFSVFACVDRGDPTSPGDNSGPANGVTIAVRIPVTSLEVGHVVTAAATATNASGQAESADTIEWSSSDTSVFVVSAAGQITARKMGAGSIYAKWRRHSGKGTLTVTDTLPAKVVLTPSSASEAVGAQMHLTAAVSTRTGRALPGHTVKWSSTDASYVSVSPTGTITGVKPGSAKVVAATSNVADTSFVTVSPASISTLSISPNSTTLSSGKTVQLTAHAADAGGNELTGRTVGWSTSDDNIAAVSTSGVVTAGKVGSATITATSEGLRATATIHVGAGGVAMITIAPASVGLVAGKTQQLNASFEDDAGNGLPAQSLSWSSANSSIATVSSSGLVTAEHAGSTTITASANGVSGKASVVVSAGAVKSIVVSPASVSLSNGDTRQLSAKLTDASGNVLNDDAAWSSSNNTVATVSSTGLVTAKRAGSATITAAAGGATGSSNVDVSAGNVSSVSVTPASNSVVSGETQQLTAKLTDGGGSIISGQAVTWSSSNSGVVSVSSNGLATAGKTGSATVTATASGKSGSATFSVAAGPVNAITITPASGSVVQGKTLQLAATFQDVAGNTVTGSSVTWASSSSSIAAVSSGGLITGVAVGSATITATSGGKSKTAAITVTAAVGSAPPPPPPPAPAPPPPPVSPPVETACSAYPHSRVVSVSTSAQLHSALSAAQPGDLIQLADGTYGDGSEFRLLTSGTSSQRITVCGSANAVINAGSVSGRDGMKLSNASYTTLSGFTITNGLFGVWVEKSIYTRHQRPHDPLDRAGRNRDRRLQQERSRARTTGSTIRAASSPSTVRGSTSEAPTRSGQTSAVVSRMPRTTCSLKGTTLAPMFAPSTLTSRKARRTGSFGTTPSMVREWSSRRARANPAGRIRG